MQNMLELWHQLIEQADAKNGRKAMLNQKVISVLSIAISVLIIVLMAINFGWFS
jgi:hypothetical protein